MNRRSGSVAPLFIIKLAVLRAVRLDLNRNSKWAPVSLRYYNRAWEKRRGAHIKPQKKKNSKKKKEKCRRRWRREHTELVYRASLCPAFGSPEFWPRRHAELTMLLLLLLPGSHHIRTIDPNHNGGARNQQHKKEAAHQIGFRLNEKKIWNSQQKTLRKQVPYEMRWKERWEKKNSMMNAADVASLKRSSSSSLWFLLFDIEAFYFLNWCEGG